MTSSSGPTGSSDSLITFTRGRGFRELTRDADLADRAWVFTGRGFRGLVSGSRDAALADSGSRGSPRDADLANRSRVYGARIWSLPAGLEIAAIRVALNEIREIRVPLNRREIREIRVPWNRNGAREIRVRLRIRVPSTHRDPASTGWGQTPVVDLHTGWGQTPRSSQKPIRVRRFYLTDQFGRDYPSRRK